MNWDKVYDVVFVGAGTAGLAGAIQAVKNGDKVLILEMAKPGEFRSSMSVIAGVMDFAGTKYQKAKGVEDSPAQYTADLVNNCGGDYDLCKAFTDKLDRTLEMVENDLGLIPIGVIGGWGHSVGRCHLFEGPKVIGRLEEKALELGVEIAWETPGKDLVYDKDLGVLGIIAENNGQDIAIKAKKGVIICTGGFGYNRKLCKEFGPDHLQDLIRLMPPTHTGIGLEMALRIGAATRDIKHGLKCSLPTCIHTLADTSIQYLGSIVVNKGSQRFIREDTWYGYLGDAGAKQQDGIYYIIYDDAIRAKAKKEFPTWLRHKEFKADTVEDLAKELKLDPSALKATMDNYNKMVAAGKDTECGRATLDGNFGSPIPVEKGPFYGMECKPSTTSFKGGIRIDPSNRVLNWDGYVIPRLYAAGEVSGGYFGKGQLSMETLEVQFPLKRVLSMVWNVSLPQPPLKAA